MLEFPQAHQHLVIEDWKNLAGLMSLDFSFGSQVVRIWTKQQENMDPSCLVPTVQAVGPSEPIAYRSTNASYLSVTMFSLYFSGLQNNQISIQ